MIFQRTYRLRSQLPISTLKERLNLQKFKVHNINFEISEKDHILKVIPHAEDVEGIKTLPITHIGLKNASSGDTKIVITSKPRKIDVGGPYLIVIFCVFCVLAASAFYLLNPVEYFWPSWLMLGLGLIIFIFFWIKMELGYFDYTRKIRNGIRELVRS